MEGMEAMKTMNIIIKSMIVIQAIPVISAIVGCKITVKK